MSISLAAHKTFHDEDRGTGNVTVQTSRCWYRVAVAGDCVTVVGPGIEQTYDTDELPEGLSFEGLALCAVLLLEETER